MSIYTKYRYDEYQEWLKKRAIKDKKQSLTVETVTKMMAPKSLERLEN